MNCRELQIDFDCPESKLDGYRQWVAAIQDAVRPVPVVITALPCWLGRDAFGPLVRQAGGYVLQVHSLERPKGPSAAITLCDLMPPGVPWSERAPSACRFATALPTTARLANRRSVKYLGQYGRGSKPCAAGERHNVGRIAPTGCEGTARGRLDLPSPRLHARDICIDADRRTTNARIVVPTLRSVMAGRTPTGAIAAECRRPDDGLVNNNVLTPPYGSAQPAVVRVHADATAGSARDGSEATNSR